MDFTREPIIESVITPKGGCKLVVRSSKGAGQEEFFVDSLEVVSFGNTFFLRSRERPKSFLVPATDYEILEVRETRMVLKNVGLDKSIKIGGGREPVKRAAKESVKAESPKAPPVEAEAKPEPKRKERRRSQKRRRTREETTTTENPEVETDISESKAAEAANSSEAPKKAPPPPPRDLQALLAPPPRLISESIERYKGDDLFKDVFYGLGGEMKSQQEEPVAAEGEAPQMLEAGSAVEEETTVEENHAVEEETTLEESNAVEEETIVEESNAVEEETTLEESNAAEEETIVEESNAVEEKSEE